ncbi:MAG: electron transfer flavoprotein subunit alpha/FixB family protein [Spirochaetes bacterium]|nr:electron transfer flavoprotein subunit alpha/FixB family protein [Spirochaetota bacterium]
MAKILVVADIEKGAVGRSTLEQLAFARKSGIPADAVLIGNGVGQLADLCAGHGAERVFVCDHSSVEKFLNASWSALIVEARKQSGADIVLMKASELGKALAPKVAGKLGAGIANDCGRIVIDGDTVTVSRPAMGTRVMETLKFKSSLKVISVKQGLAEIDPAARPRAARRIDIAVPAPEPRNILREIIVKKTERVDLGEARIVISIGRGAQRNLDDVNKLADSMGAAVGATRPVIDAGLLPYNLQVGQTGRKVSPDLYIALGISGSILHVSGMVESKCIVAVNRDPQAPIFAVADYGIVGDVNAVLPVFKKNIAGFFK